jgi:hypothetical protein
VEKMLATGPQEAQVEAALLRCLLNIEKENFLFDRFALIGLDHESLKKEHPEAFSGPEPDLRYIAEWNLARKKRFEDSTKKGKYGPWISLCGKFASDPKTRQPALWSCMASYLTLLEGDAKEAERLHGVALAKGTKNTQLRKQIHLIGTLIALQKVKGPIPMSLQKRLIEDLAWASTLQGQGNNSGIYHSLLALLAQKYLVLRDLPRASLSLAAIGRNGYRWGIYHEHARYLMDAVMDDKELGALRSALMGAGSSPLDAWLKKRSGLLPDDIQVLRAVKQARRDNYQAALTLLEKVPPGYLKFVKRVKDKDGYWREAGNYKGSTWVSNKAFIFQRECVFVDPKAPVEQMDIVSYFKMMKDLRSRIDTAKATKDGAWCSLTYELASILGTQMLTGWPEVRRSVNSEPDRYIEEYSAEVGQKYPFKIPGMTEFMDGRYKGFLEDLKNYNKKAFALCSKVIQADLDPEVAAKSLAFASVMEAPWIRSYSPEAPNAQERLKLLRDRYSGTEFYKRYVTWCGPLKALAGAR